MAALKTFWERTHPLNDLADKLMKLIPRSGRIEGEENAELERFRQGANLYWEIYNNGCGNFTKGSYQLFGITQRDLKKYCRDYGKYDHNSRIERIIEQEMAALVRLAAFEQGIR